ncbi:MAG TPA: cupin [Terracidiphilus sp.]|jgi:uncharacterized protein YjlB|nr:cupin [Terracidiphilus sp.]
MTPVDRRQFKLVLAAVGSSSGSSASAPKEIAEPEVLRFSRNGWIPNNDRLPVLLYRGAIEITGSDPAALFERLFERNGWPPQWRDGVFDFQHYHSTAHEVLGFAAGKGRLMLGGENGQEITVHPGDVLVLPTGTGHCSLQSSEDFQVVGAYPAGQEWDICRTAPTRPDTERMLHLPFPDSDPLTGKTGALAKEWRRAA